MLSNAKHPSDPKFHPENGFYTEGTEASRRAQSSKEATEADAFLCDLDPNLCALYASTPLLWLRLRRALWPL
jgi:hypothetical protein